MIEINPSVLVYLVQVVDEKLRSLKEIVGGMDDDNEDLSDYEEELLACSKAAMELKQCYEAAASDIGNMPPYSELLNN